MGINFELTKTLGTARGGKGGEYFTPGYNYHAVIEKCEWKKARDGNEFVIVDFQILESDCPTQGAGRKPCYMINMSRDTGAGNLAEFLRYGLSRFAKISESIDIDPNDDEYWKDVLDDKATLISVLEEEQMLVGTDLYLYTKPIKTKKNNDFTIHQFSLTPTKGVVGAVAEELKN
jgi:hypothetical protein